MRPVGVGQANADRDDQSLRFIEQRPADTIQFIAKEWGVDERADELYKSMLPAFSRRRHGREGIRDALKRETEPDQIEEEAPLTAY